MKYSIALNDNVSISFLKKIIQEIEVSDFYCGFVPETWSNRFGWEVSLNRRENDKIYHFSDYNKLLYYKKFLEKHDKELFVAFNSHHYSQIELSEIDLILKKLKKLGCNNFIISDLNIYHLIEKKFDDYVIRASIGMMNRNFQALEFYKSLGIKQFILPRDLSIKEIIEFLDYGAKENLLFEVFFISYKCPFSDEVCYSSHGYQTNNFCQYLINADAKLFKWEGSKKLERFYDFYNKSADNQDYQLLKDKIRYCGICFLNKFEKYNNVLLKIPVRGDESDLGTVIDLLSSPDFKNKIADSGFCDDHINCYYNF